MESKIPLALALFLGYCACGAQAQLTIDACHRKAQAQYPLAGQLALIEEAKALDVAMARRGYLPRLSVSGKASYQSDVTSLSSVASSLPPSIASALSGATGSNDQYQALAELAQTIWDGGAVRAQMRSVESSSQVDRRKLEVDLYALNGRVDQLFFGILSLREQSRQNDLARAELDSNYHRLEGGIANGIASQYDLDELRVRQLDTEERAIELSSNMRAYTRMLSDMIGEAVGEDTILVMPSVSGIPETAQDEDENQRPELRLLDSQKKLFESQKDAVRAANSPKFSAFVQAAYGQPGLNMFKSGFSPYWIAGLRMTWSLNGLLDMKDQFEKIDVQERSIEAQRGAFLYNSKVQADGYRSDISKLQKMLETDEAIISLREGMRKSTEGKMDNGTAMADDVLKAIDAETLARRAKSLHEIQLAIAIYALKNALSE